ncbi:hypothetical protein BKA70DRAFT_1216020 [Coprinopsis sp. MPI-PUGE-AT-0042]|nr:hypothetical protein BKA70DRAFT_1216020 [Coprinopsis sp. MPI-PUGE-AT-0042]
MNANSSIFQACSNVQVNGGSFNVSGRDTNTQTVHYHTGSTAHHFGYASNVNTGRNNGHFSQGASQGFPQQPPPPPPGYPPYMGGYGYGGMPGYGPPGGWNNAQQHGYPYRSQTYPQPTTSPPATDGPTPHGAGAPPTNPSPSPSASKNPFRNATADASSPPPRPSPSHRPSSDCAQTDDDLDDLEVEEIQSPGVAENPTAPQDQGSYRSWASMQASWGQRV